MMIEIYDKDKLTEFTVILFLLPFTVILNLLRLLLYMTIVKLALLNFRKKLNVDVLIDITVIYDLQF